MTPLRESVAFRWLWAGQSLSSIGSFMTGVAVAIQVYELTGSSVAVGAVSLATLVPTLLLGLFGGSIADAVDRRRLVLLTGSGLMLVSLVFATQAFLDWRQVWLLYLLTATSAALAAIDTPARRTFIPRVLPLERLPAAAALTQLSFQVAIIAGPLLAGVLIASVGLEAAYALDAATFAAVLVSVRRLPPMPPEAGGARFGVRSVVGPLGHIRRQGRAMLISVAVWGAGIGAVGLTNWLWLAVLLLATAGAADIVTTVFRATILQTKTPDELRGRLNSLDFIVGLGGPNLGNTRAGTVAGATDPITSIITGGAACVLGVLALSTSKAFRTYDAKAGAPSTGQ